MLIGLAGGKRWVPGEEWKLMHAHGGGRSCKDRLARGEAVFGSFAFLPSPDVVEIMGMAGFDYVIIDTEHSPKCWENVANMIRAARLHDMDALVRVAENTPKSILAALEVGADGIVVPFVQSAADVDSAVRSMNYAPKGDRGTCTLTRAAHYGALRGEFVAHAQKQNDNLMLIAQIEDQAGVDNIEEILACHPGLDAFFIGRADLASSIGKPGMAAAPEVLELTDRLISTARNHRNKVPSGIGLYAPDEATQWLDKGCRLFFYSADTAMLTAETRRAAQGFHSAVAKQKART
jgi:4-hydroxy-2-oxoheptanedioate aldolase